jgi:fatty acid-binding protein DegV
MNINEVRIVADSSADVLELSGVDFGVAPLKIITAQKEYVDEQGLDVVSMVQDLANYKGRSSSSCPNASDWLQAFGNAKYVFCVTITSGLSGSFASAVMAKGEYEEAHPDRKVFVLDSLSAGPELTLFVYKFKQLIFRYNAYRALNYPQIAQATHIIPH